MGEFVGVLLLVAGAFIAFATSEIARELEWRQEQEEQTEEPCERW